jgi:hypothetical protein
MAVCGAVQSGVIVLRLGFMYPGILKTVSTKSFVTVAEVQALQTVTENAVCCR